MGGQSGIEPEACRLGGGCAFRCATGPRQEDWDHETLFPPFVWPANCFPPSNPPKEA